MKQLVAKNLILVIVSGYLFPIGLTFLPGSVNTKMILAVVGAMAYFINGIRRREATVSKYLFGAILFALAFSLICYVAIVYNNTYDDSFSNYFFSFFTWLGGAYAVCTLINQLDGEPVNLRRLTIYMTIVCVAQCISALMIDRIPAFKQFVDSYIEQGQWYLDDMNRLYGIGASLDPAGVRFSVVLILLSHVLCMDWQRYNDKGHLILYFLGFCIIVFIGNMISRTTLVGAVVGLCYILFVYLPMNIIVSQKQIRLFKTLILVVGAIVIVAVYLYNTDSGFRSNIRFAFEGFFNWAETGVWRTDSTDKLNNVMWIWPTTTKDWIIGTGLFGNWVYSTDIGYCRYILYCGLIGFGVFAAFFVYNAWTVTQRFDGTRLLALCLLATTFIVWIKVATDIFFIYALMYCLEAEHEERLMERDEHLVQDV